MQSKCTNTQSHAIKTKNDVRKIHQTTEHSTTTQLHENDRKQDRKHPLEKGLRNTIQYILPVRVNYTTHTRTHAYQYELITGV